MSLISAWSISLDSAFKAFHKVTAMIVWFVGAFVSPVSLLFLELRYISDYQCLVFSFCFPDWLFFYVSLNPFNQIYKTFQCTRVSLFKNISSPWYFLLVASS